MIDYEILKIIWWLLIGVLLAGFAVMDGQDMGVGALLPFLGKNDTQRRCMINAVAPHWDGNQVWLLTGGGAIFAAWPLVYAVAFSGFYWAMLIVLLVLILRPVGFDFRSKLPDKKWRTTWDWSLFAGSAVPPVIFGVAFGNLLVGVPFHFDETMRVMYTGSFWGLLNPFALLCGLVSLSMIVVHGACWLILKTEDILQYRAAFIASVAATVTALLFITGGLWVYVGIDGYVASIGLAPGGPATPLAKTVDVYSGGWFTNFLNYPALFALPLVGIVAEFSVIAFARRHYGLASVCASGLGIISIVLTPLVAMFPFVLPSSSHPSSSLTIWDCCSSQLTLEIMLVAVIVFLPFVLSYTAWAYHVMSGKVTDEYIAQNDKHLY